MKKKDKHHCWEPKGLVPFILEVKFGGKIVFLTFQSIFHHFWSGTTSRIHSRMFGVYIVKLGLVVIPSQSVADLSHLLTSTTSLPATELMASHPLSIASNRGSSFF